MDPHPSLLVVDPDGTPRQYLLAAREVVLGRGRDCDLVLADGHCSRRHAAVRWDDSSAQVEDLGSANGTFRGSERLGPGAWPLADGDVLRLGGTCVRLVHPGARAPGGPERPSASSTAADLAGALSSATLGATLLTAATAQLDSPELEEAVLQVVVNGVAGPALLVHERGGTREVALAGRGTTIGRGEEADLRLGELAASRRHARIERTAEGWLLRDLGSRAGTTVNGVAVPERLLADGDVIRIGAAVLSCRLGGEPPAWPPAALRPVVLVPGMGGSELRAASGIRLWPNLLRILSARREALEEYLGEVEVRGIVREVVVLPGLLRIESFGRLAGFLVHELGYRSGRDLLEFPYDWRADLRQSARGLAGAVRAWRATLTDPAARVTVIAHSMGGLVARWWVERLGGADAVERVITLGTPHRGAPRILRALLGGQGALPLGLATPNVRILLRRFASAWQLLPDPGAAEGSDGTPLDLAADDRWLARGERDLLHAARAFRTEIESTPPGSPPGPPTTSVFGYGQPTPAALVVRREPDGTLAVLGERQEDGDGAVPSGRAIGPGSDIHPVRQQHGALYADRDVQRRIRFELAERREGPVPAAAPARV